MVSRPMAPAGGVMLISFSVPEMLPYIRAGIEQAKGRELRDVRVKRQTIRQRGPRAQAILKHAAGAGWTHPYDLHLWWKSRTPARELLGVIEGGGRAWPIEIMHSYVEPVRRPRYACLRIVGASGWRNIGPNRDTVIFWSAEHGGDQVKAEAMHDGFESAEAFRDYFVPNMGDVFNGVLFRW